MRSTLSPVTGVAASRVTPLILTLNEEPNLQRTLGSLNWANEVVILDSGSTDRTREIARSFPNVRWVEREFDSHGRQWEFAVRDTGIGTEYILALDADMVVPAGFVLELERAFLSASFAGGVTPFQMVFEQRVLVGGIYPAQLRVFRKEEVRITQKGHTQCFEIDGPIYVFRSRIRHEDQKPFSRWIRAQLKYAQLELDRIDQSIEIPFKDKLRRAGIMPAIVGALSYARAGGPFLGRASLRYALERTVFECILGIQLIERNAAASGEREKRRDRQVPG